MTAVSSSMMTAIQESLKLASQDRDELVPLKEMDHHYCSLNKLDGQTNYMPLFTVRVDGRRVYIYLKV